MTDTKHEGLPVAGYKPQGDEAVEIVNISKAMEEMVMSYLDALAVDEAVDKRWLAIGRTQIEQGFMAVNRAVFKPGRLEIDAVTAGLKAFTAFSKSRGAG